MSSAGSSSNQRLAAFATALALSAASIAAPALCAEKTLYKFENGSDGANPHAGLISDGTGNLYGTTLVGGDGGSCEFGGCGTVFKILLNRKESVLYAFKGGSDGEEPVGGLIADTSGNLYGTTAFGGTFGKGTVFEVASDGTETTLYSFQGGGDGEWPLSALLADGTGNLFGTTAAGGSFNGSDCTAEGCGTVFELKPDGTKIVLYTFQGGNDGWSPSGTLIMDQSKNLFGTTAGGGNPNCPQGSSGCGTVFKISPDGTETQLYVFQGGSSDGSVPESGLVADAAGNFYGTTGAGGSCSSSEDGCGTVFKLAPSGTETLLYAFQGGNDGYNPGAGLIMDKKRNLYGTTFGGGGCPGFGCGTVFEVAAKGKEKVLYVFGSSRGRHPVASLLFGKRGALYGTTMNGGKDHNGVVFEVEK